MPRPLPTIAALLIPLVLLVGCGATDLDVLAVDGAGTDPGASATVDALPAVDSGVASDATAAAGTAADEVAGAEPDASPAPEALDLSVGGDACCLAMAGDAMVWIEGGDLWIKLGDESAERVEHPANQKDPAISDRWLVWADDRGGDFDLYMRDLESGDERALVEAPGDQRRPVISGDRLVWLGADEAPHGARQVEVFTLDLSKGDGAPRQLTDDDAEQDHPHISGDLIVWTDYSRDADGMYVDTGAVNDNNGDIFGWDLAADAARVFVDLPSKQSRPATDGASIVWLDWRHRVAGPEPKYAHFRVYATDRAATSEVHLADGAWQRADLWQRPAVRDGIVAWIAEASQGGAPNDSVFVARWDPTGMAPVELIEPIAQAPGRVRAVAATRTWLGWVGDGQLSRRPLDSLVPPN